jgi:hypothetical protein
MPGSLPAQSQKMYSSQPELNNYTEVLYKRGRSTQEETEREAKRTKESEHWLNQTLLPIATQLYWKRKVKTTAESRS